MFILSDEHLREFLSAPGLIRLVLPDDSNPESALLISGTSLILKYLVRLRTFTLLVTRLPNDCILYAVKVDDDPTHPAAFWSLIETDNEMNALRMLLERGRCNVFLFNEGAINVCWAPVDFLIDRAEADAIIAGARMSAKGEWQTLRDTVDSTLDSLQTNEAANAIRARPARECSWQAVKNYYITAQMGPSLLDLVNGDEGDQQESLALWLTDALSVDGTVKSPQIHEGNETRELTDILFSYVGGSFLIESKTLSVFDRSELPDRTKLKKNVLKNVRKAVSQLAGACRSLKRGLKITNANGTEIEVDRSASVQCIVLVPDLTLMNESADLGGPFIDRFFQETGAFLHFLDPVGLLRSVQHAIMLSKNSESGLPPITTFDAALMVRWEEAKKSATPNFALLMRVG